MLLGYPPLIRATEIGENVLTGRRYKVEFTQEQAAFAEEIGNICREVWNIGLEQRREYRRRGGWMNYAQQAGQLAEAKGEHGWLKAAPSHTLQQTLMDLDRACKRHGTFSIRWRSKRSWSPSFRFPVGKDIAVERLNHRWGRLKLPKLGRVRFRWSRSIGGIIRSATVSRAGGRWFVSLLVETGTAAPEQHPAPNSAVGVDRGVKAAIACSNGWGIASSTLLGSASATGVCNGNWPGKQSRPRTGRKQLPRCEC